MIRTLSALYRTVRHAARLKHDQLLQTASCMRSSRPALSLSLSWRSKRSQRSRRHSKSHKWLRYVLYQSIHAGHRPACSRLRCENAGHCWNVSGQTPTRGVTSTVQQWVLLLRHTLFGTLILAHHEALKCQLGAELFHHIRFWATW